MRIVLIGASEIAVMTAKLLGKEGHEVILIEEDRDTIDTLSDELDCSFLQGDGSHPSVLREVGPDRSDFLLCLTDNDQVNIIAGLVGRALGFSRVVTSIQDPEFEGICDELNLKDTIIPSRTISRHLLDLVSGVDVLELSTAIKGEARLFQFVISDSDACAVQDLGLPKDARVICCYRNKEFMLPDDRTNLRKGDEVVILTHSKNLPDLVERWKPNTAE